MSGITVSWSFGSGGSVVARQVAESLGWDLVNRAIPADVAQALSVPIEVVEAQDEQATTGLDRMLDELAILLSHQPNAAPLPPEVRAGRSWLRRATEDVVRKAAERDSVIVGRAIAIVLGDRSDAFHVRLDGPRAGRILQAMAALTLTRREAEGKLDLTDRAREAYVKRLYGKNWRDASLYHMIVDSTSLELATCAKLVV